MNTEQQQEISSLRALNLTPKQIARQLGLKPALVNTILKQQAQQVAKERLAAGELEPVAECWVNADCACSLLPPQSTESSPRRLEGSSLLSDADELFTGLALVAVTRQPAYNRFSVCTYLVDPWCLGVKDAHGPRQFHSIEYTQFIEKSYQSFALGPQAITLEQAQAIVFSALEYAAQLGFSPARDFEAARPHLGQWDGQTRIECGRHGKPFYVNGPHDHPPKILKTLTQSVGEGNFDYWLDIG